MTIIYINEHTGKGKSLIEFLKKFEGEEFIQFGYLPNEETRQAIHEAREGYLNSYNSTEELFNNSPQIIMYKIKTTNRFEKDFILCSKRNFDLSILQSVILMLATQKL